MHSKRAVWIVAGVLAAISLIVGTWIVATRFQSPAQRQAAAAPPAAQPVVVDVIRADLVERTTTQATAARQGERAVAIPLAEGTSVITRTGVEAGTQLASGGVVTWVNDRPVIAVRGAFQFFRDFGQGDKGDDVRQLQQALADLGYDITPDGTFGEWTATCLKELYKTLDTEPTYRESVEPIPAATPRSDTSSAPKPESSAPAAPRKQVMVRANEFLVLPDLPAHVTAVPSVGTTLTADNAKVGLGAKGATLTAAVPGPVAVRLKESSAGEATYGGKNIAVRVSAITKPAPATEQTKEGEAPAVAGDSMVVEFAAVTGEIPTEWVGKKDVLVSLDLSEPLLQVLQVPQRAIAVDASGQATVLRQRSDGSFEEIRVTELVCSAGTCAVKDGAVDVGDRVRVDR